LGNRLGKKSLYDLISSERPTKALLFIISTPNNRTKRETALRIFSEGCTEAAQAWLAGFLIGVLKFVQAGM